MVVAFFISIGLILVDVVIVVVVIVVVIVIVIVVIVVAVFCVAACDVAVCFVAEVARVEDVVNNRSVFTVVQQLKLMRVLKITAKLSHCRPGNSHN